MKVTHPLTAGCMKGSGRIKKLGEPGGCGGVQLYS